MAFTINPATIIFLVFLAQATIIGCFRNEGSHTLCIEREKQALLSFKQDLVDPFNKLKSWDVAEEEDCCEWAGVVCDNITGHVSELRLNEGFLQGKINPSLLNLTHLSHLDLSSNDFGGIRIPSFLGSLVSLRYLNLTHGGFDGMIPHQLGNLSSLHYLHLGDSHDNFGNLYVENLHWLSGLSSLEYLDLTIVNLSKASDHWLLAINTIPSLRELRLSSCGLHDRIHFPSHVNLTSLEILDLSDNSLEGPIPHTIENLTSIVTLNLTDNQLEVGNIPKSMGNLCNLETIDLSLNEFSGKNVSNAFESLSGCLSNSLQSLRLDGTPCFSDVQYSCFTGEIPEELGEFKNMVHLSLNGHNIHGPIPMSIGKLSALKSLDIGDNQLNGYLPESIGFLSNIEYLYLHGNKLNGPLPKSLGSLSNLKELDISHNQLNGPLPKSLGSLSNLKELHISDNQLNGPLPTSLGSLSNLEVLFIRSNHLEGPVSEVHFANLTNLRELIAYGNQLSLKVSPYWIPPFRLDQIEIGSWNLGPPFPVWLKSQKNFSTLNISNTGISDVIPNWFWNLSLHGMIDLSKNKIYGEIPYLPAAVNSKREMHLNSNNFSGPLSRVSSGIGFLDLSNNSLSGDISHFVCEMGHTNELEVLRLRDNLLSGDIPDCWKYWPSLQVIDLVNNNMIGEIPSSMGSLKDLSLLLLRNNSLTGKIHASLQNCSNLYGLDLGLNKFVGTIPRWIGRMSQLQFLGLRSNNLTGHVPVELCALVAVKILDVADNMLHGTIPKCFNNFTAMTTQLDTGLFSYGFVLETVNVESAILVIKGNELQFHTTTYLVTYLDLSSNNLSGEIPKELTSLQGLQTLNLSGNSLNGSIPGKMGNMTWMESLDLSRNQLSGKIPPSMSSLTFLSRLNLSFNNLSGKIPTSTQLQSLDASGFIGNQLCGPPLTKDCGESEKTAPRVVKTEDGEGEEEEEYWFRLGIAMGFVVSFLGINGPLLFSRIWRRAYFWFFQEYLWYKILDCYIRFKYILQN